MRICILGATGLVGRETLELVLGTWPEAELELYGSRDQELEHGDRRYEVWAATRLESGQAARGDLAFVALDDAHSKRYVPRLLDLGYRVIDKSNTYRADPAVPLAVAGVNDSLVTSETRLAANPNCTTIPLVLALNPLGRRFGLESVTVSTYQAISGAGVASLDQFLAEAQEAYAAPERLGLRLDAKHYVGNTVPHNGGTDDTGFSSEERKLVFESRRALGLPELSISAQCCRVPVAVGHYENVWVRFAERAPLEAVAQVLQDPQQAPFVNWVAGAAGDGLTALACVHDRDRALLGRLRVDGRDASERSICLTVVADNLRLGAATNAVRVAQRWFPRRALDG
jgi:aspartate-semialdehyde dehydrogenase